MSFLKTTIFRMKHRKKDIKTKQILSLFLIITVILNFLYILNNFTWSNDEIIFFENGNNESDINSPNSANIGHLFQDPFKRNFEKIWQFFKSKYLSDFEFQLDTYYREGNSDGTIIVDDKVYPIDNLLLYMSLLKDETNLTETYENYLKLKESLLWFEGDIDQYKYGFVKSIDNSTKQVYDYDRYLIDNLMPIFLLIENIGEQIDDINIGGQYPEDSIIEMFNLINSSEFWDETYKGFYHYNSTTNKYTESNLYAILANLAIHKIYESDPTLNNPTISKRAYELANITMKRLLLNSQDDKGAWDYTNGGFIYSAFNNWNTDSDYKYLRINALGIITLIEFWKETGMINDTYLQKAEYLYRKLGVMWNSNAYEYRYDGSWGPSGAIYTKELEANSIMLTACLKLFEITGNITYYNRAWQLHETFENVFYDGGVNTYSLSIASPVNNNKNLYANLKLCEAYLYAAEIYNSTVIKASYNVSETIPDYIFNQDIMNVTSIYAFEKDVEYFNKTTDNYETYTSQYNIDPADISYIFKLPNGTLLEKRKQQIIDESITLLYNINDTMPIGNGYYLYIYANTSIFATALTLKRYNIISGLKNVGILGLPSTLYQGPTLNVTLQINNTRNEDVSLNVYMEGEDIFNETQIIFLSSMVLTNISFNLTAVLDADLGPHSLKFELQKDNILYLEIIRTIEIGHSFDYTDFFYEGRAINGGNVDVSLKVINFLPDSPQFINISFSGEDLDHEITDEIVLSKSETRTLYYSLTLADDIVSNTIEIEMSFKKGKTIFYTNSFSIQIIQKFEILSVTFPEVVSQGDYAYFIMIIQNNQDISELFSLYVNGERLETNINGLGPGENKIIAKILPTINPYDFESKSYTFVLKDGSNNIIAQYYFDVKVELTAFNFIVFYLLPIIIPIGIVLFYKNKEIKHKLLRR